MTPSFAVVTDSTADIAPSIALEEGIDIVPLSVSFGTDTMPDGTLSQEEFFARMAKSPALPTTSQPSVGAFIEAYERALERAESVVSVHISNRLSGTVDSARQAAEQFAGRVHVFDSLNLSWGLAFQVVGAARAAADGMRVDAALAQLEHLRSDTKLIVGLDSLDNLAKGGRIGRVSAFLGSMLNLKVTLTVDPDGAFQPVARSRGDRVAFDHTLDWIAKTMGEHTRGAFAIGYALNRDRAERIAAALRERYEITDLFIYDAGSVICTHTGTGWGVAVVPGGLPGNA